MKCTGGGAAEICLVRARCAFVTFLPFLPLLSYDGVTTMFVESNHLLTLSSLRPFFTLSNRNSAIAGPFGSCSAVSTAAGVGAAGAAAEAAAGNATTAAGNETAAAIPAAQAANAAIATNETANAAAGAAQAVEKRFLGHQYGKRHDGGVWRK
jgi:hypothetical protein